MHNLADKVDKMGKVLLTKSTPEKAKPSKARKLKGKAKEPNGDQ